MWKKSDFDIKEFLGEGVNTRVYKAIERSSNKQVALKIFSKRNIFELNAEHVLRREIEIQFHLKFDK